MFDVVGRTWDMGRDRVEFKSQTQGLERGCSGLAQWGWPRPRQREKVKKRTRGAGTLCSGGTRRSCWRKADVGVESMASQWSCFIHLPRDLPDTQKQPKWQAGEQGWPGPRGALGTTFIRGIWDRIPDLRTGLSRVTESNFISSRRLAKDEFKGGCFTQTPWNL